MSVLFSRVDNKYKNQIYIYIWSSNMLSFHVLLFHVSTMLIWLTGCFFPLILLSLVGRFNGLARD